MLDRRMAILAGAAAFMPRPGLAQAAERFSPPPEGEDAYGLKPFVGARPEAEALLRNLREPAILTPGTPLADKPVFRLTEMSSLRGGRSALLIFNALTGSAESILRDERSPRPPPGMRDIDTIINFEDDEGVKLRALVDDRERFWEAARVLPENRSLYADGVSVLLEGRVGAKRQAIWRDNPGETALVSQLSKRVF